MRIAFLPDSSQENSKPKNSQVTGDRASAEKQMILIPLLRSFLYLEEKAITADRCDHRICFRVVDTSTGS